MVRAKPLVHHVRESLFIVQTCTHTLLLDEAPTVKRNKILSKIFIETCYLNRTLPSLNCIHEMYNCKEEGLEQSAYLVLVITTREFILISYRPRQMDCLMAHIHLIPAFCCRHTGIQTTLAHT